MSAWRHFSIIPCSQPSSAPSHACGASAAMRIMRWRQRPIRAPGLDLRPAEPSDRGVVMSLRGASGVMGRQRRRIRLFRQVRREASQWQIVSRPRPGTIWIRNASPGAPALAAFEPQSIADRASCAAGQGFACLRTTGESGARMAGLPAARQGKPPAGGILRRLP